MPHWNGASIFGNIPFDPDSREVSHGKTHCGHVCVQNLMQEQREETEPKLGRLALVVGGSGDR